MTLTTERPAYRILATHGFFGPDDHLYQEGDEIYYDDTPNEEMEPLNEAARVKLEEYLTVLDDKAKEAAEKFGRPFIARPRTLDGAIAMVTEDMKRQMSIMGSRVEKTNIEKMDKGDVPETGSINPKKGKGRPKGSLNKLH